MPGILFYFTNINPLFAVFVLGVLRKLSNHLTEFGRTDALCVSSSNVLLSSGYDLDYGISYVNGTSLLFLDVFIARGKVSNT